MEKASQQGRQVEAETGWSHPATSLPSARFGQSLRGHSERPRGPGQQRARDVRGTRQTPGLSHLWALLLTRLLQPGSGPCQPQLLLHLSPQGPPPLPVSPPHLHPSLLPTPFFPTLLPDTQG